MIRADSPGPPPHLRMPVILTAVLMTLPVGGLAWYELLYLQFGATGRDPGALFRLVTGVVVCGGVLWWALRGAGRPAEVVRNAFRLGIALALLLPIVAVVVLFLWQRAADRPDLGMGGMMLYAAPFVAVGVAALLVVLFAGGRYLAVRKLRPPVQPDSEDQRR